MTQTPHHVHFKSQPSASFKIDVDWTAGEDVDERTTILVDGRPSLLPPNVKAVVIPWAGVPPETVELAKGRAELKLFNLHHNAGIVAEHTLALLLAVTRRIVPNHIALGQGDWSRGADSDLLSLSGKTACILGYGAIGRKLEPILLALGMKIVKVRRTGEDNAWGLDRLEDALSESHVLLCLLPGTPDTVGLLRSEHLRLLRSPRIVINVGRGPVIEERGITDLLASGELHGAGLDVWYQYPKAEQMLPASEALVMQANLTMSPHVGGQSDLADPLRYEALSSLIQAIVTNTAGTGIDLELGY